jgi:hypothetical protein
MKVYYLFLIGIILMLSSLFGKTTIEADLVSRYVWRGQDYGNAAAIQPNIEKQIGSFALGAWGSWALNQGKSDTSFNECDLYISTKFGPLGITLTDYFNPDYNGNDKFFHIDEHIFEINTTFNIKETSFLFASNILGDDLSSIYLECSYQMLTIGIGNGSYTVSGNFLPISIGLKAERDKFSASYIINPDRETSFLVFGVNL